MEALTHRNLSRWFPLLAPTDFVHFLPPPRVGNEVLRRKLRLVCSAAGEDARTTRGRGRFGGFRNLYNQAALQLEDDWFPFHGLGADQGWGAPWRQSPGRSAGRSEAAASSKPRSENRFRRRWKPASSEHLCAVPLRDGQHVLFTDPHTGKLCIGSDAALGPVSQLERIVWLAPPAGAASSTASVYAAGDDMRHGVRVIAVFPAVGGVGDMENTDTEHQLVVLYTIPPDAFDDLTRLNSGILHAEARAAAGAASSDADELDDDFGVGVARASLDSFYSDDGGDEELSSVFCPLPAWAEWWPEPSLHFVLSRRTKMILSQTDTQTGTAAGLPPPNFFDTPRVYPLRLHGLVIGRCSDLVDVTLDSCPDMVVWAFSGSGLAQCWVLDTGRERRVVRAVAQGDGSLREVDDDGDVGMEDLDCPQSLPVHVDGWCSSGPEPDEMETETGPRCGWTIATGSRRGLLAESVRIDSIQDGPGIALVDFEFAL